MNFSGTKAASDFLKLTNIPDFKKPDFVDFAATDFLTLRQSLIKYIKAVYPLDYQYFIESDLGNMMMEVVSYMGAVMSMKADMLANENFLATAKQRSSVKKLLELVGVSLKGPTSAAADARITFQNPMTPYGELTIIPENRVFSITSPEDGASVNYTLYKTVNGLVDTANSTGNIVLDVTEASDPDTSSIFSNLVFLEGAFVTEDGSFLASDSIKTVELSQFPVVDGSVEVFLTSTNDNVQGAYTEVENLFFASSLDEKIFEVVYDDNYKATVVFGDGRSGISPDSTAQYFITYRVGGGTRGNIAREAITESIQATNDSAATVEGEIVNISLATGGANAESVDKAKKYAPLTFRRQDRLVTLEDYAVFANTFTGSFNTIGKAVAATRKAYSSANVIDIYLLEKASAFQLQKATTNFKRDLLEAINLKKMATDDVVIVDGLIRTIDLVVTVNIDSDKLQQQNEIVSNVRGNILEYMNVDNREFGEALTLSELNRKIFEIPEVRFSTIDNLDQDVSVNFNEIVQLNNLTININILD